MFNRGNVQLVDEGIHLVEPRGIVTRDGTLHELDVIVLATGFDAQAFVRPMELIGPDGVRLSEVWEQGPYGYRSVGLPGVPERADAARPTLALRQPVAVHGLGDPAGLRHPRHQPVAAGEVDAMAPTREATDRFNESLRAGMAPTVWVTGCDSWFLGKDGLPSVWPFPAKHHRDILRAPELTDWHVHPGPAARDELRCMERTT